MDCLRDWRIPAVVLLLLLTSAPAPIRAQRIPPDGSWTSDAFVEAERKITDLGLGAVQGVVVRDGKIYAYGDVFAAAPRVGVIREYGMDLAATGRVVWLRTGDRPRILHPTGLTWHLRWGTFLGDTVQRKAVIYKLDWERMWKDGNLDAAIQNVMDDDAAIDGCRPAFVELGGKALLATADYGQVRPEVRLYDPEALLAAGRSSAPGVIVHRVLCGPYNQNLYWDGPKGQLTCIQNVIEGRGWRLEVLDLSRAVADGRASGSDVLVRRLTFPPHDELEGFWALDGDRGLFAIARRRDNVVLGKFLSTDPRPSPAGTP
jgi:hypothetical protein